MSLIDQINLSTNPPRTLVQLTIISFDIQWVNVGAGIWESNFNNSYDNINSALLGVDYSTQTFTDISSVLFATTQLLYVSSLELISSTPSSFYYDPATQSLFVRGPAEADPRLNNIQIGTINGLSFDEFIPINANSIYQGRLIALSNLSKNRDPIYFGKIAFNSLNFTAINNDGEFDTFAESNDLFGNQVSILQGYDDYSYLDYNRLFTGIVERANVSETTFSVDVLDTRKYLSKSIIYNCINKNALDAILEIIQSVNSNITYNSSYFDTTTWEIARALAPNITIYQDIEESAINTIETICLSCFGIFFVNRLSLYSFKIIDTTATPTITLPSTDIMEPISISYDPSEVISSLRVSYNRIVRTDVNDYKTWLTDTSSETSVYEKYKIYNQKDFDTYLIDQTAAQAFATKMINYVKDVHGTCSVKVPMKYFNLDIGDIIYATLDRENSAMLGTKTCEIIGIEYDLSSVPNIRFTLRIV